MIIADYLVGIGCYRVVKFSMIQIIEQFTSLPDFTTGLAQVLLAKDHLLLPLFQQLGLQKVQLVLAQALGIDDQNPMGSKEKLNAKQLTLRQLKNILGFKDSIMFPPFLDQHKKLAQMLVQTYPNLYTIRNEEKPKHYHSRTNHILKSIYQGNLKQPQVDPFDLNPVNPQQQYLDSCHGSDIDSSDSLDSFICGDDEQLLSESSHTSHPSERQNSRRLRRANRAAVGLPKEQLLLQKVERKERRRPRVESDSQN